MKRTEAQTINSEYRKIKLGLIDTEGQSVRDFVDDDHVVELSMSILKNGLLQPIVVRVKEDGRYQLMAGFHRLSAFHRIRAEDIPCHVMPQTDTPVRGLALVENICRRDMTLSEEVNAVTYLTEIEKLSTSQICDLLGKSRGWVDIRLTLPQLPDNVRQELLDKRIGLKHAEILGKITDDGIRGIILNATVQQKLTARQTEDLAELYNSAPTMASAVEAGAARAEEIQNAPLQTRQCEACGQRQPLGNIMFIAVCANGCRQVENKQAITLEGDKPE